MNIEQSLLEAYPHLLGTRRVHGGAKKWMLVSMVLYMGSLMILMAQNQWQFEQNQREIERTNLHLQSTDAKVDNLIHEFNLLDKKVEVIEWQVQAARSVIGIVVSAVIANIVALFFLYLSKKSSIRAEDLEDLRDRLERIERAA